MTPRTRHILVAVLTGAGLIAVLGLGAGWWMVTTERGAIFAFDRLGAALPGKLQVGSLAGSIRGPLEVRNLSYHSDRLQVTMDRLAIHWSLRGLLLKRLNIRQLDADNVRVEVASKGEKLASADTSSLPDLNLPLDIMIQSVTIHDLRIVSTSADSTVRPDTAIVIERVTMKSVAFRDTLSVGSLALRSAWGDLELKGGGRTRGRYALDLMLNWTLHPPGRADLHGGGRVVGNLDTLRIQQTMTAPIRARVDLLAYQPLRDLRVNGRVLLDDFDSRAFDPTLPAGHASGTLDVTGRLEDFTSRGAIRATTTDWGRLQLVYDAERKKDVLRVRRATLTPARGRGQLVASGSVGIGSTARNLQVDANWHDLDWPLNAPPVVTSERGSLKLLGTIDRYRITAQSQLHTPQLPAMQWQASGTGDMNSATFPSLHGVVLGGAVTGSGAVAWLPAATWRVDLAGRGVDPATHWPGMTGQLAFTATTAGHMTKAGPVGTVELRQLSGTLRAQPVSGQGTMNFTGLDYTLPAVALTWGGNRLTASGSSGAQWGITWALDAPNLSAIPRGAGRLAANGTVTGPRLAPRFAATARGDSLRLNTVGIDRLAWNADIDTRDNGPLELQFDAAVVRLPNRRIDHLGVHATGSLRSHRIEATARAQLDSLRLALDGGLAARDWQGHLATLDVFTKAAGNWTLEHPAVLAASAERGTLREFCWRSDSSRVCADAAWDVTGERTWSLQSTFERARLALLGPFVPPNLGITGSASGTIDLHGMGDRVLGDARLDLGPGEISYPVASGRRETRPLERSSITLHGDDTGLRAGAGLGFAGAGTVQLDVRLPGFRTTRLAAGTQPIDGHLQLRLGDLGMLQGFIDGLAETHGTLDANLALDGTTGKPRVAGDAKLAQGTANVPRLGLELRDIAFSARSDAAGHLTFDGGLRSGTGRVTLQGDAQVAANGVQHAHATLAGKDLTAMHTSDMSVYVSPNLELSMDNDSLVLTGQVRVPRADIRGKAETNLAVVPSPDVVFVGRTAVTTPRPVFKVHSEVRLVLGQDVRVRAYGLDAKPTGSVLAIELPGQPTTGTGSLVITNGTYKAYGQSLTIETGRLEFAGGPIENPGLSVRASRKAKDGVTAGFEVHGTLEAPQLSVFSDPPMADRDALAYVVLGHGLDQRSQNENGIVTQAANSLGLNGGNYLAGTLARTVGLDQASIESQNGSFQSASLMLGTFLSPRVYVNYGVGILDQMSTLRVQYFLDKRWTLEAETGAQSSAQIQYTIERGKRGKRMPAATPTSPPTPATPPQGRTAESRPAGSH